MSKILLVEDDLSVAKPFVAWLESESYTVDLVTSGEDAVQLLATYSFDVIVLDWELPGVSGYKVLQTLREKGKGTPVIFLTGRQDMDSKVSGLNCGADDYLIKPCDPRELSARVRSLLRRPWRGVGNAVLSCGDVSLHPETGKFLIGAKSIRLTSKEFAVLEFLFSHQSQVFSAKNLLRQVWNTDSESTEGAVRQAMTRLRRKLSSYGAENVVKTTQSGYVVESET